MTDPAPSPRAFADGTTPLSQELANLSAETAWHCFTTDRGHVAATTPRCPQYPEGSGTTVIAPTPALLAHEIAVQEHEWALAGVAA